MAIEIDGKLLGCGRCEGHLLNDFLQKKGSFFTVARDLKVEGRAIEIDGTEKTSGASGCQRWMEQIGQMVDVKRGENSAAGSRGNFGGEDVDVVDSFRNTEFRRADIVGSAEFMVGDKARDLISTRNKSKMFGKERVGICDADLGAWFCSFPLSDPFGRNRADSVFSTSPLFASVEGNFGEFRRGYEAKTAGVRSEKTGDLTYFLRVVVSSEDGIARKGAEILFGKTIAEFGDVVKRVLASLVLIIDLGHTVLFLEEIRGNSLCTNSGEGFKAAKDCFVDLFDSFAGEFEANLEEAMALTAKLFYVDRHGINELLCFKGFV